MHVLGLTNMRTREMQDPFETLGDRGTLVTVDADAGIRAYLSGFRTAASRIDRYGSDAILVYNGTGLLGVVAVLLSLYYDVPLMVRLNGDIIRQHRETAHDYWVRRKWSALAVHAVFHALTRLTFVLADGFVPVSETLVDIVRRQTGCPAERVVSVPNPIQPTEYRVSNPRPVIDSQTDADLLLTVTNLDFHGKYVGVRELVDALAPLLRERPDLEYVIAGDGRYYGDLRRFIGNRVRDDSVARRIHVPGFVDEIAHLYANADVFVYASYIDGYPNVILEAQAAGVPIVTNPAYGIVEQVDHGVSGVFANPGDPAAFAGAVAELLDDTDKRTRLGRNARQRVADENTPESVGQRLYEAIESMIRSPAGESQIERMTTADD